MDSIRVMESDKLEAFRITDWLVPAIILKNPLIEKDLYEDGYQYNIPDVVNEIWVGVNHQCYGTIAVYRMVKIGAVLWQGHAHVLPEFRKISLNCTRTALIWAFDNVPMIEKLTTIIPVTCPNVIKHIERIGMVKIGTLKSSYMKKGKLVDQEMHCIDKLTVSAFIRR